MATISRANLYHVPVKQWNRWTPHGREVFNIVYSTVRDNQGLFLHPKAAMHSREHWKTAAWNTAWIAANAAEGYATREGGVTEGRDAIQPPVSAT